VKHIPSPPLGSQGISPPIDNDITISEVWPRRLRTFTVSGLNFKETAWVPIGLCSGPPLPHRLLNRFLAALGFAIRRYKEIGYVVCLGSIRTRCLSLSSVLFIS